MPAETRTIVSFKSTAFNTTEPRAHFINPCCFGDDLAKWLIQQLRNRGIDTDSEPGQEDFGWYFNFRIAGTPHTFVIGHCPGLLEGDDRTWVIWVERHRGLVGSMLGARKRGIDSSVPQTLHSVLSSYSQIQDIRWHYRRDFDKGHEELRASAP